MRLAPRNNACAADHGAMWIMLMQITASAAAIGHCAAATSRKRGCRRLVCAATAIHEEIERRQASSCSLGCQVSCGITCAKWRTCSPVPLPTSSTTPDGGRSCASTTAIGSLLRAAEGLASRPSSEAFRSSSRMPYRNLFERQHHRPGYRISNAEATAEVFQSVAEGIERCDHLRPRIRECIHVRPLGDDAIRAFPGLDHVHMKQARPRGVNLLVGIEEFLLTSGLHSKTHGVEGSHGPPLALDGWTSLPHLFVAVAKPAPGHRKQDRQLERL